METKELIESIKRNKKPYSCTMYLLGRYRDLKNGKLLINDSRKTLELLDNALNLISDDEYYDVIRLYYIENKSMNKISKETNLDISTTYKQRKRLIKRVAIILFGDEAL